MVRFWLHLLFSLSGRISRRHFWAGHSITLPLLAVIFKIDPVLREITGNFMFPHIGIVIALAVLCWVEFALAAKRLHDLNDSAWCLLFGVVAPYVGPFCLFVALGLFRGTSGPNRFGRDVYGAA